MKVRLTEKGTVAFAHKETGYEIRDEVVRGLILRVGAKTGRAKKVWEVIVSTGGGSRRRVRLGTFPDVSVKAARVAASAEKEETGGRDRRADMRTVGDLFERYKSVREPQMRAWRDVESVWRVHASRHLRDKRLADLTRRDGLELRDAIKRKRDVSALRAASVIRYLRPMFAWAADEGYLDANPWADLKAKEVAPARDRVLSSEEWADVWAATGEMGYPFGPLFQVLMLSAQRLGPVAAMRWDEIAGDVWVVPAEKMKATRPDRAAIHEVPLSNSLAELIACQPRIGPYVFTTMGDRPVTPGSRQKDRLEKLVNGNRGSNKGTGLEPSEMLNNWRLHDLRRSGATLMTSLGVSRFILERVLGHADLGVTAVYDRSSYRVEKREALEMLAATLAHGSTQRSLTVKLDCVGV